MFRWTTLFITTAVICAFLGYGQMVGSASIIAKFSFFVFIILYLISMLRTGIYKY